MLIVYYNILFTVILLRAEEPLSSKHQEGVSGGREMPPGGAVEAPLATTLANNMSDPIQRLSNGTGEAFYWWV